MISKLVCKARKNPRFLKELMAKEAAEIDLDERVALCLDNMQALSEPIKSMKVIQARVNQQPGKKLKMGKLQKMMKKPFKMRYSQIKPGAPQLNSGHSLVMRQSFAEFYLHWCTAEKVVLNFDESWLNYMDNLHMKWHSEGEPNTVSKKKVAPRVTLLMALDNHGRVYACLA